MNEETMKSFMVFAEKINLDISRFPSIKTEDLFNIGRTWPAYNVWCAGIEHGKKLQSETEKALLEHSLSEVTKEECSDTF